MQPQLPNPNLNNEEQAFADGHRSKPFEDAKGVFGICKNVLTGKDKTSWSVDQEGGMTVEGIHLPEHTEITITAVAAPRSGEISAYLVTVISPERTPIVRAVCRLSDGQIRFSEGNVTDLGSLLRDTRETDFFQVGLPRIIARRVNSTDQEARLAMIKALADRRLFDDLVANPPPLTSDEKQRLDALAQKIRRIAGLDN